MSPAIHFKIAIAAGVLSGFPHGSPIVHPSSNFCYDCFKNFFKISSGNSSWYTFVDWYTVFIGFPEKFPVGILNYLRKPAETAGGIPARIPINDNKIILGSIIAEISGGILGKISKGTT